MKQAAINYGKALFETGVSGETVAAARATYEASTELQEVLKSPIVEYPAKAKIVERVFSREMTGFFKLVCYNKKAKHLPEIFQVFEQLEKNQKSVLSAVLYYTMMPDEAYITRMKEFLQKKYQVDQVDLKLMQDTSLIGGFVLQVGNEQYDYSAKGAMENLRQKLVRR